MTNYTSFVLPLTHVRAIVDRLDSRSIKAFSLVNKYYNDMISLITADERKINPVTKLFPRQEAALAWLKANWNSDGNGCDSDIPPLRLQIVAYLSFGKTLLCLAFAEYLRATNPGPILIMVPSNVLPVWIREVEKHRPQWIPRLVAERSLLVYHSCRTADMKRVGALLEQRKYHPNCMDGLIILATEAKVPGSLKYQVVIVDESHRNSARVEQLLLDDYPMLIVGGSTFAAANAYGFRTYFAGTAPQTIFPVLTYKIHQSETPTNDANALATNSPAKHILLCYGRKDLIPDMLGAKTVYNFTTHNKVKYGKYVAGGGVLAATLQTICEGENINECNQLIFTLNNTTEMQRARQLIGRVSRQSQVYKNIEVHIFVMDRVSYVTALLARIDCAGYSRNADLINFRGLNLDLEKLTDLELMTLFTAPIALDRYCNINYAERSMSEIALAKLM